MGSATADNSLAPDIQILPKDGERPSDSMSDTSQMAEKRLEKVPDAKELLGEPEAEEEEEEEKYVTGVKLVVVLTSITVVYFLMLVDNTIIATAIPYITDQFHSLLDVGWYGSAYQLTCASLQPLTGKIYSRLNSKSSFLVFLFIFEFGSLLCGVANSSTMLIVGRAVAGLGGSGLLNGGLTILNSCVPAHRQPALVGILMALGTLGIAFGPLLGGALTEYASWRWCFYINLPVGAVVAVFILLIRIPDKIVKHDWRTVLRNPLTEFDLIGFALFAPSSVQFFLALQYGGNQYAWNSATVIGLFCGAGVNFIIFLMWNYRQGDLAMIPVSMLSKRVVWSSCSSVLFFAGSIFVTSYYLPIYFQVVKNASPLMSGVDVLPNILPQMVMTGVAGKLVSTFGYYLPFMLLCGVLNAVSCGILSLLSPTTSTGTWVGYQILLGIGRGLGVAMPILALQHALPPAQIPIGMSIFVFCQNFGGAVMVVFSQTIFINSLRQTLPKYAPSVNPAAIIQAGATRFRQIVADNELGGVLLAYSKSLGRIYYLTAAVAVVSLFLSSFMGWADLREKQEKGDQKQEKKAQEQEKTDEQV